ncbi:MAG: hypothetical protein AMXMBFR13_31020 [Phycisphaerae bacterium]
MSAPILGTIFSLLTAFLWAVSPLLFASAARRIGSFPVVLLRSALAAALLAGMVPLYAMITGTELGMPTRAQIGWLALSGLTGLGIGDILLYESFNLLGARRAMQVLALAPVGAILFSWIGFGETLSWQILGGIILVMTATSYAVLGGNRPDQESSREPGRVTGRGLALAAGGALFVGIGAVAARQAFRTGPDAPDLDPALATAIRVISVTLFLWAVPIARGTAGNTVGYLRNPFVLSRLGPGTLAGPFGGMLCYLLALKYMEAGPVSALVALSPLFIIPMVAVIYRARIGAGVVVATAVAVVGVALICIRPVTEDQADPAPAPTTTQVIDPSTRR